jgi:hypothetical protein
MDEVVINDKSDAGETKVSLKRLEMIINEANTVYFNKSPESEFFPFPHATMDLPTEKKSIVVGFYMVNYELKSDNKKTTFFLKFNGSPIKESKQISLAKSAVLTGAFAWRQDIKSTSLSVEYGAKDAGSIEENKNQSFHFGAIQIPDGPVLKNYLNTSITLNKSPRWTPVPNLYLRINNDKADNQLVVIMYSISIPIQNANEGTEFGTRLKYGNRDLTETSFLSKGLAHYSAHGAYAIEIEKGSQDALLEYKYTGDIAISTSPSDNNQVISLTTYFLPSTAMLENCKLDGKFNFVENRWKNLGFKKQINIPPKRAKATVLVLYHVNLSINKRKLSVALTINGKKFKNNISTANYTERANIQGYGVFFLKGGVYNFDIQYLLHPANGQAPQIDYDPNEKGDTSNDESIYMQIILLD